MKNIMCVVFCTWFLSLEAQFTDNFSDGELLNNPVWSGNVDSFQVNNEVLQLNAPANSSESFIVTPSAGAVAGFWEFELRMDFNPSSSNKAKVYLMSDTNDLKAPLNAYFVMLGNSDDEISLYKQVGTNITEIIDGQDDLLDRSVNKVKVKVERDAVGNFSLYADTSQGFMAYDLQGQVYDATLLHSNCFGILCDYTVTRSDKFWFDNITVSAQVYVDQEAPVLIAHQIKDLYKIDLLFSELPDTNFALLSSNYSLAGNTMPLVASVQGHEVSLEFSAPFEQNIIYQLEVAALDFAGNLLDTSFQILVKDNYPFQKVLINEIYADEEPSLGMPDYEFLELSNTSSDTIILEDWKIADASDTVYIPNDTIFPLDYLILCKTTAASSYSVFGRSVGVPNFPSLNNTGDALKLFNKYGGILDSVSYTTDWYADELDDFGQEKKNGGYSLERIQSTTMCSNAYNWFPSLANNGATPGEMNTVVNHNFPPTNVQVERLRVDNDTTLVVYLNHEAPFISEQDMSISNMGIEQAFSFDHKELFVMLDQPLSPGSTYQLSFTNVVDCRGIPVADFSFEFYNFDFASADDLIINEVLFNPKSGGSDFLEIYNKSDKLISLTDFQILEYDALDPTLLVDEVNIGEIVIGPNEYIAFSKDTMNIFLNYIVEFPDQLYQLDLPNFNDDQSIIVLKLPNGVTADSLMYHKSWHLELLDNEDGASLERISPNVETNTADNWQTAARTYGYGTPTYRNSQNFEGVLTSHVSVEPEVFTPNEDGVKDFCVIQYQNGAIGELANIAVYNLMGQEVKLIAQNHSVGFTNQWKWNGTNNNFEKADVGIYIVLFELFDLEGKKQKYKEKVVLGTPLN